MPARLERWRDDHGANRRAFAAEIALAPGDYSVEASLAGGARAAVELRVSAERAEMPGTLTLDLR